jgi:lipopolysaccharide export system permease protein
MEVAGPFLAAQAVFVVMFLGTDALTEATKLISRYGLPWQGVVAMILLRIPWAVGWTMPMSVGMAVILAMGRLCKDGEYAPMVMGGLSFRRLVVPMMVFAVIVSVAALWVEEFLGPNTMNDYYTRKLELQSKAEGAQFEVHMLLTEHGNPRRVTLDAAKLDPRKHTLEDVTLTVRMRGKFKANEIDAVTADWQPDVHQWLLHNAVVNKYDQTTEQLREVARYPEMTVAQAAGMAGSGGIVFENDPNSVEISSTDKPDYLPWSGIRELIAHMVAQGDPERDVNRVRIYLYRRWTLASSCLLFLIVGAPLGVRHKRADSLAPAFATGLAMILTYYIIWNATSFMGEGSHQPWMWAWSANLVTLLLGIHLFRRVPD